MSKKTINVSQQLLNSIVIGLLSGIIIVFLIHLSNSDRRFMPKYSNYSGGQHSVDSYAHYSSDSKVEWCTFTCPLGSTHQMDCTGIRADEVGDKTLSFGDIFSATFDGHWSTIFLIGLSISAIIYIIKRVSFKVVKE